MVNLVRYSTDHQIKNQTSIGDGKTVITHIGIGHIKVNWENKIPIKEKAYRIQKAKFLEYKNLEGRKKQEITDKEENEGIKENKNMKKTGTVIYQIRQKNSGRQKDSATVA